MLFLNNEQWPGNKGREKLIFILELRDNIENLSCKHQMPFYTRKGHATKERKYLRAGQFYTWLHVQQSLQHAKGL